MITLIWATGALITAKDWRDAEDAVRAAQWKPYKSRREFRREMRYRAKIWSGAHPLPVGRQTHRQFIESLAAAGMFIIAKEDTL